MTELRWVDFHYAKKSGLLEAWVQTKNLFDIRLPDGSILRNCIFHYNGGFWWNVDKIGDKFIDPEIVDLQINWVLGH